MHKLIKQKVSRKGVVEGLEVASHLGPATGLEPVRELEICLPSVVVVPVAASGVATCGI